MIRHVLPVLFLVFAGFQFTYAQSYQVHTLYMYSFTRYIKWPESSFRDNFRIGILGQSTIRESVQKMSSVKKVGDKRIEVVEINNPGEIRALDMLFVAQGSVDAEDWLLVTRKAQQEHILLMTEEAEMPEGGHINFITIENKTIFQLNRTKVELAGLRVATELLALAQLI